MNRKTVSIILSAALAVSTLTMPLPWNQYTVKAEELNFKENGYDTPEETALAFVDAMKNKDIEQMASLFAIESYVQYCNIPVWLNSGSYSVKTSPLPMDDNIFTQKINLAQRKGNIFYSIRCLYLNLSSCFDSTSFDMREGENGEDVINRFWKIKNEDNIFNIEATGIKDVRKLYESRNTSNTTYDDLIIPYTQQMQEKYGCNQCVPIIVQCNWNNLPLYLFMEVAKYDNTWLILNLGGYARSIFGFTTTQIIVPGCVFGDEEEQNQFSFNLATTLNEIVQKEANEIFESEKISYEGYETPEEAINIFFENMKQNDLEGILSSMNPTLQYQNIDVAKRIELAQNYWSVLTTRIPLCGKMANILNQEQIKYIDTARINECYLSLVGDGIDFNSQTANSILDAEAFVNSLKGSDCSILQYENLIELSNLQSLDENKPNYDETIMADEVKTFSVNVKLGERSATDEIKCSCYNGQWVVTNVYPQEQ